LVPSIEERTRIAAIPPLRGQRSSRKNIRDAENAQTERRKKLAAAVGMTEKEKAGTKYRAATKARRRGEETEA
jgi:hypothetical protein